ncbi:hypothetical protein [Natrinema sp. 1APR25-10V2]|uniref:hypothetical protein n=1 Tax=Natrinema sp. 1APR25-10V2 TaxID=2951081 RepID=UPI0028768AB3|nr:hypothetical protein [Natrinema sp. 1APR25-10V2]MDS0476659.1 hypothetical protein [Natrinema sp. 1APR25-10V2]
MTVEILLQVGLLLNSFADIAPAVPLVILEQGPAAAIGIGLAAIGAGYAERGIGASVIGALAEDSISPGIGILMTVLPETLVIFALVALFV